MGRSQQQVIAGLMDRLDPMVESPSMSTLMGSTTDDAELDDMAGTTMILAEPDCEGGDCGEDEGFNEFQLKVAKRFIELMGGADKARAVVDKVDECEDCLGLIDDEPTEEDHDSSMIQKISGMLPGMPDLPMQLSNLYNPAAGGSSM